MTLRWSQCQRAHHLYTVQCVLCNEVEYEGDLEKNSELLKEKVTHPAHLVGQSQAKVKRSGVGKQQPGKNCNQTGRWVGLRASQPGGSAGPRAAVRLNDHWTWVEEDRLTPQLTHQARGHLLHANLLTSLTSLPGKRLPTDITRSNTSLCVCWK